MKRLQFVLFAGLFVIVGCAKHAPPSSDDRAWLDRIDQKFLIGDTSYVLAETQKYLGMYPQSFHAWSLLGWACVQSDDLERADQCFDTSLSINPQWDNAYVGKGAVCRARGDTDAARDAYLKALGIVPDNAEAFASLLVIELQDGNDQQAVIYGEKAWSLRKDYPTMSYCQELCSRALNQAAFCRTPSVKILPSRTRTIW